MGWKLVLGAMRLARLATGRRKIAYFRKSYHGLADAVLATEAGGRPGEAATAGRGLSPGSVGGALVLPYGADSSPAYLRAPAGISPAVLRGPLTTPPPSLTPTHFPPR